MNRRTDPDQPGRDLPRQTREVIAAAQRSPQQQTFYVTAETPCPYLMGYWERKLITELRGPEATALHSDLSRAGFRRSHRFAYRPACADCDACRPVRVDVARFTPSRSLRRVARRNSDLVGRLEPPIASQEQFAIFAAYLQERHDGGEMTGMDFQDYRSMTEESCVDTEILALREPDGRLRAACLIDWMDDGISAVYSFFAPQIERRSLGTYCVIWLIEEAKRRGLPYVYLGYWIAGAPKMAYKRRFRPLEMLGAEGWQSATEGEDKRP